MKKWYSFVAALLVGTSVMATVHSVATVGNTFVPATLSINVGDTVTWTIASNHNVNGTIATFPSNPMSFTSGAVGAVATYTFIFQAPGVYNYHCDPHAPSMSGTITVNAATFTSCTDLFISEYLEGSSNNKAIEIYNPTMAPINLANYRVELYGNGGNTPNQNLQLAGTIAPGDVYVIANSSADPLILAVADTTSSVTFFNGDDAVTLKKNGLIIDVIGTVGLDPGSNWTVGTGSTAEFTLVRTATTGNGTQSWADGVPTWSVLPQNTFSFLGAHLCISCPVPATIAQYTGIDATTGVADSLGVNVTLSGTVFTIDFDGNAGYNFWMHDGTDGIYIFSSPDVDGYVVTQGDQIEVRGTIGQFNGLTQLVPDSIYLVSQNNPIQTPTVVTTLDETTESELVRINNVTLVTPSQWPASGSANVDVTDGTNTYLIRIDSDTDIDGSPAPTGPFDVVGAGGQFDNSNPFTSGYQIQPRALTDIIPVVVTTPTASFVGTSMTVLENAGTVTVSLQVSPVSANPETLTLQVALAGASPTDGSITPAPDPVTGLFTLNLAAGADSTGFTITVNDDTDQEPTESITITLSSSSAGVSIGTPSVYTFSIEDNDTPIPTYDIADLKGVDANGVPDSLNVYCKVNGTVFSIDFDGNAGYSFYISDGTGGINVFSFVDAPNSYQSTIGDSIRVIGSILQFNGLTEIDVDSIHFYSAGNPVVSPVVVTTLDETTESELVRLNGVSLVNPSQWPVAGASANVDITDGVNTFVMRIDSDTDIDGTPPVGGTFDLIGVGNQFDNSSPYTSGYQIFPRSLADYILPPLPTLAISEVMASSNDPVGTLQGDWFEILNYGNANINLEGFSFDDNSELSNQYIFPNVDVPPGSAVVVWDGLAADEAAFAANWGIDAALLNIISSDELTGIGGFPAFSSSTDDVVLFDSSSVPVLLCKVSYTSTVAGVSMQFDTLCNFLGNSVTGGTEYNSLGGDLGSPGNFNGFFSVEENLVDGFSIYPNPSNGVITLRTVTGGSKTIQVLNSLGQVVMHVENDQQETVLSLNHLPKGLYIVRLEAGGKQASQTLVLH